MMIYRLLMTLLALYSAFFIVTALASPWLAAHQHGVWADVGYATLAPACQQGPLRSVWLWGYPMALCARCLGIYTGTMGFCFRAVARPADRLPWAMVAACALLGFGQKLLEWGTAWDGGNGLRWVSGMCLGLFAGWCASTVIHKIGDFIRMKRFNTMLSGLLALSLIIVASPALAGDVIATKAAPAKRTWSQWVQSHDTIELEYRYPGQRLAQHTAQDVSDKLVLPAGTPVVITLTESVDGDSSVASSNINYQVVQDVVVGDNVVIRAGTTGTAQVSASEKRGLVGQAGRVVVSDFSVKGVDGTYVPLRGTISAEGKDKLILSVALSLFVCPAFILMKGGNALIPSGTQKTVYTAADARIKP